MPKFNSIQDLVSRLDINAKAFEFLSKAGVFASLENLNELEAAEYIKLLVEHKKTLAKTKERAAKARIRFEVAQRKWQEEIDKVQTRNAEKMARYTEKHQEYEEKLQRWEDKFAQGKKVGAKPVEPVLKLSALPEPPVLEDVQAQLKLPDRPRIILSSRERLKLERDLLRTYISGHPLDELRDQDRGLSISIAEAKEQENESYVTLIGVISGIKVINTRTKKLMGKVRLEDKTGGIEIVLFPSTWEKFGHGLEDGEIYLAHGKLDITTSSNQEYSVDEEEEGTYEEVRLATIICNKLERITIGSDKEWEIKYPVLMGYLRILPGPRQKSKDFARATIQSVLTQQG